MIKKQSAGILLYRSKNGDTQIFLVHPGGPFWKKKDIGTWSIPKGEFTDHEKPLDAAIREFEEEVGTKLTGNFIELTPVKLKTGKTVYAWALESDLDASGINCTSLVTMELPAKSGKFITFPEVDKGEWFSLDDARQKINLSQVKFIDELEEKIK